MLPCARMANPSYKALYRRAQFLYQLGRDLERLATQHDASRVVRFALRGLGEALEADVALQVDLRYSDQSFRPPSRLALSPKGMKWVERAESGDAKQEEARLLEQCRDFIQRGIGPEDRELLLVKVSIGERVAAVLGYRRPGRNFGRADATLAQNAAEIVSHHLRQRANERAQGLKEKIYGKLLSELRPKDVLYQLLHGLERLLQYDHSGTVLLLNAGGTQLVLQAEIVTWTKAKSTRVGRAYPVTTEVLDWIGARRGPLLLRGHAMAAPEESSSFNDALPSARFPEALLQALDDRSDQSPAPGARIVAPLLRGDRALGLLQIQGRSAAAFTADDLALLSPFLPLASASVYNSELYETQHDLLISAERKVALADLARAISHDLNNAFGVMLPLLQALKRDLTARVIELEEVERDLEVVTHYAEMSARIFKGLLSVARGRAESPRWIDLGVVIEAILTMLGPSLIAKHVVVEHRKHDAVPTIFARRGEMEQLILNLLYNARDAMPEGGRLEICSMADGEGMRLEIRDTGVGIPAEIRSKIFEPFFTTKESGSGLGLDICRSIVWDYDGRLELDAASDGGTVATVWLPRQARAWAAAAAAATPGYLGNVSGGDGAQSRSNPTRTDA